MQFKEIVKKYIRGNDHDVHVSFDDNSSLFFSFDHDPSQNEVEVEAAKYIAASITEHQYDSTNKVEFDLLKHKKLLKDLIGWIKARPSLTLAQWNTMLGTRLWWEAAVARYFVYSFAIARAESKGLELEDYTETTVLKRLRNWIVDTTLPVIYKTITGNANNGD
jgi:hypothetical protein